MKSRITLFAFASKCGSSDGALRSVDRGWAAAASSASNADRATAPKPEPARSKRSRRLGVAAWGAVWAVCERLINSVLLVRVTGLTPGPSPTGEGRTVLAWKYGLPSPVGEGPGVRPARESRYRIGSLIAPGAVSLGHSSVQM